MTAEFYDDFAGSAGALGGRVSPTGHTWGDANGAASGSPTLTLDGAGHMGATVASNPPGSYGDIHLAGPVTRIGATISWTGSSAAIQENGACVLICSETATRSGSYPPSIGIYADAIHPVFGLWQFQLSKYIAGTPTVILTYTYPGGPMLSDGTPYKIGLTYDGERLAIDCPDGVRKFAVDPDFKTIVGPNLIYQVYRTISPNLWPRFHHVEAYTSARLLGNVGGALAVSER